MTRFTVLLIAVLTPAWAAAQVADPAGVEFFEKKVRPVLSTHCYKCHSHAAEKLKGKLYLDSREGMLKGGETGPAVVPGRPEEGLFMKAVRHGDPETAMPPKEKLPDAVLGDLQAWIRMGAPWPAENVAKPAVHDVAAEYDKLRKELWSWQPVRNPAVPRVTNEKWAKSPIDAFILAKLDEKKLTPSTPADKATLIRRATFDLVGVPPTPAEVEAFVRDSSPNAFEKVVDRLLASPQFGERWGRHWLDVARYAESTGMARNFPYFYAWRYRDYVIRSFNEDKPYSKFIVEQLAGDLLPARDDKQRDELTVATGFLCIGPRDLNERNREQFLMNNVDEMIDATSRAMLGTTVACARCHDHKFDPIPTSEYYAIAGIFKSTQQYTGLGQYRNMQEVYKPELLIKLSDYKGAPGEDDDGDVETRMKRRRQREMAKPQQPAAANAMRNFDPLAGHKPSQLAMGVRDVPRPADTRILVRGETDQTGPIVRRGFVSIPNVRSAPVNPRQSGRMELALWIGSRENPLTARVMVNRIWQHLFGKGIVGSVDNFGMTGERPTHPELLDHLATQFMDDGWSVKRTIRRIMLSATYQQGSGFDRAKHQADPENDYLWRMNQRRLEAEAIRDSILAVSGKLDKDPPHGSQIMNMGTFQLLRQVRRGEFSDTSNGRSVYLPIYRSALLEVLDVFDLADPNNVSGQRDVTTVPPQALFMMNSDFVMRQATAFAQRVGGERSELARIDTAYKLALGRMPTAVERERATSFMRGFAMDDFRNTRNALRSQENALAAFCQALFASAEFRYVN